MLLERTSGRFGPRSTCPPVDDAPRVIIVNCSFEHCAFAYLHDTGWLMPSLKKVWRLIIGLREPCFDNVEYITLDLDSNVSLLV